MIKGIFIDGEYKESEHIFELLHPHTKEEFEKVAKGNEQDMIKAIDSASAAFQEMKQMPSVKRAEILKNAAEILQKRRDEFAKIITLEAGKPITASRVEVERSVQTLLFAAEEAKQSYGEYISLDAAKGGEGRDAFTIYQPLGVIGAITPFNFPVNLTVHKVGPAIATGNTIVVKPASQTPLSACLLAEVFIEAGLPKGAFNVVSGEGGQLGDVLLADDRIKKISFTGSPKVGKMIKEKAGLKRVTLELGSNSALYIDASVKDEMEDVVKQSVSAAFAYNGQVCIHTQRIYVHKEIANEFIEQFITQTKSLPYGDPFDEDTVLTGLISEKEQKRVLDWINQSVSAGAELKYGGEKIETGIEPTILVNVPKNEKVVCEEVFGPVVVIQIVESADQALAEMNDSDYGLNAGMFTNHLKQAMKMAHELEVGQVLINDVPTLRFDHMPYGGVKSSGYGHEGVKYAMKEMTNMKLISIHYQ